MRGISAVEKAGRRGACTKVDRRKASVNTNDESAGPQRNFIDGELALGKTVQRSYSAEMIIRHSYTVICC